MDNRPATDETAPRAPAARETLGMTQEELFTFLDELLQEEAAEAAAQSGNTVEQELDSPGFASARAASSYAIHLIAANNAFLSRHLIDLGLLPGVGGASSEESS